MGSRNLRVIGMVAAIAAWCGVTVSGQTAKISDPKAVPGLVLWLDAADAGAIVKDAAGKVSKWSDKSGKGGHAEQADLAAQPLYEARAVNQLPGILFNGSTTMMRLSPFGQKTCTAFVVGKRSEVNENPFERVDGAEHRGFVVGNQTATYNYFPEYRVNGILATDPADWKGNIAVVTGVNGEQTPAAFKLGFGSPGYAPLNGALAEILIYERKLTADEIVGVEQYLLAKWQIAAVRK